MKRVIFLMLLAGLFVLIIGCSDKTTIINSNDYKVRVSGTVYAWRCGVDDFYNNNIHGDLRLTTLTEEKALISFVRLNGLSYTNYCDDSSHYNWTIDEGAYNIILQTGFNWPPDTVHNVYLSNDTIIDFNMVFDFLISDTLEVAFYYSGLTDTLGADSEWTLIRRLNGDIGNMLNISHYGIPLELRHVDTLDNIYYSRVFVTYMIPIWRDYYHLGKVSDRAREALEYYAAIYPSSMSTHPAGLYICLM